MKRRIVIVLLLLAGGAIVNVAVAWGFSTRVDVIESPEGFFVPFNMGVDVRRIDAAHVLPMAVQTRLESTDWWEGRLNWRSRGARVFRFTMEKEERPRPAIVFVEAGWPFKALYCTAESTALASSFSYGGLWMQTDESRFTPIGGGPVGATMVPLPSAPLPVGFTINTLFYALLLWLLFFAPFAARRMLRRRRGLCEQCAYPIGVSPVCTECGAALSVDARRASQ